MPSLEERVAALEQRMSTVEAKRPGRKSLPIVVSEAGVCGIDPDRDSASCEDASLYRRQKGCKGTACTNISTAYWANYRSKEAP
jgi:hypothetical protein